METQNTLSETMSMIANHSVYNTESDIISMTATAMGVEMKTPTLTQSSEIPVISPTTLLTIPDLSASLFEEQTYSISNQQYLLQTASVQRNNELPTASPGIQDIVDKLPTNQESVLPAIQTFKKEGLSNGSCSNTNECSESEMKMVINPPAALFDASGVLKRKREQKVDSQIINSEKTECDYFAIMIALAEMSDAELIWLEDHVRFLRNRRATLTEWENLQEKSLQYSTPGISIRTCSPKNIRKVS